MAWALHFLLGTWWTYALHRHYTFRHVPQLPYGVSLARTYGAYMGLWALSSIMMLALCDLGGRDPMLGLGIDHPDHGRLQLPGDVPLEHPRPDRRIDRWTSTDLTLIVPTKNEAHNIHRFLEAIPPEVPILIVDASSDGTDDIIRRQDRHRIRMLRDGGNIAAARQLGAERAQTEWLLFTDADVIFADDYFRTLAKLRTDRAGAASPAPS